MGAAAGTISTIGSLANTYQSYKNAKNTKAMSYSNALEQAQNSLNSLYDKNVTNTIGSLNKAAANRGFYGQAAADQLKSNTVADIRANQASDIAKYATQLQSASAANAANAQNAFTNSLQNLGNLAQQRWKNQLIEKQLGQGNGLWNYLQSLGKSNDGSNVGGVSDSLLTNNNTLGYPSLNYGNGNVVADDNGGFRLLSPNYGLGKIAWDKNGNLDYTTDLYK
ncbi:MAG: hypothetical protein PVG90_02645 [Bacillota bacterium]|jgi:hypothetical protein